MAEEADVGTILRDEKGRFASSVPPTETPQEAPAEPAEAPAVAAPEPVPVAAAVAPPEPVAPVVSQAEEAYKKAMREEREKRQRLEQELRAFKEKAEPPKDPWTDLPGYLQDRDAKFDERLFIERCNLTEEIAREKHKDYDEILAVFTEAGEANPNLFAQLRQERNPAAFVYKEGTRIRELKDVGGDFAAYKTKIEKDVEARIRAELAKAPDASSAPLPTSLNSDASPAAVASYQGPPPLKDILSRKV
jgi:hypothetical protein